MDFGWISLILINFGRFSAVYRPETRRKHAGTCSNASGHVLGLFAERCESQNSISGCISIDFPSFAGLEPEQYLLKPATTVVVFCLKICLLSTHFAKISTCGGLTQAKQLVERAAAKILGFCTFWGDFPMGKWAFRGAPGRARGGGPEQN